VRPPEYSSGVVLPAGAKVASVTLDGRPVHARRVQTARGVELIADVHSIGRHALVATVS